MFVSACAPGLAYTTQHLFFALDHVVLFVLVKIRGGCMFLFCQAPVISTMTTTSRIYWCLAREHWLKHTEQDHQMDINALYPNHVPTPETQQQFEVRSVQHELLVGKCSNNHQYV